MFSVPTGSCALHAEWLRDHFCLSNFDFLLKLIEPLTICVPITNLITWSIAASTPTTPIVYSPIARPNISTDSGIGDDRINNNEMPRVYSQNPVCYFLRNIPKSIFWVLYVSPVKYRKRFIFWHETKRVSGLNLMHWNKLFRSHAMHDLDLRHLRKEATYHFDTWNKYLRHQMSAISVCTRFDSIQFSLSAELNLVTEIFT